MQKYYYKATLDNGVSRSDSTFIYKLGLNTHPKPDKLSKESCGVGIHLAKTISIAKRYVPEATEFYLAKAGVILGEDENKIRCSSCILVRKLSQKAVNRALDIEALQDEQKKKLGSLLNTGGLCGKDWLLKHMCDVTEEDINNLKIEVKSNGHKFKLGLAMKKKDRLYILQELVSRTV